MWPGLVVAGGGALTVPTYILMLKAALLKKAALLGALGGVRASSAAPRPASSRGFNNGINARRSLQY